MFTVYSIGWRVWRYQREVIRIRKSKKDGQHNDKKTDNTMTKRQTTQWQKDRQHNDKKKGTKWQQRSTLKIKDRVTQTPLKTWDELRCSKRVSSSCSTSSTRRVNLVNVLLLSRSSPLPFLWNWITIEIKYSLVSIHKVSLLNVVKVYRGFTEVNIFKYMYNVINSSYFKNTKFLTDYSPIC
jgi:hypothetical protein